MCINCENKHLDGEFINASAMNAEFPEYPAISDHEYFMCLNVGSAINVKNKFGEGFWLKVISLTNDSITGSVDNDLQITPDYNYQDVITVKRCHVRAILGVTKLTVKGGQILLAEPIKKTVH